MIRTATEKARKLFEQPVNKALDAVAGLFKDHDRLDDDEMRVMALIKAVMPTDSAAADKAFAKFRAQLERQSLSERKIAHIMDFLQSVAPGTPEAALPVLKTYDRARQQELLSSLLSLAIEHGVYRAECRKWIHNLALALNFSESDFDELAAKTLSSHTSRAKIIKSGTGIVLALVVIVLFVMIATWLSSLLFGLALAYMFLPLEQYFERKLKAPPSAFDRVLSNIGRVLFPFGIIREKLLRRTRKFELSNEERKRREQRTLTTQATTLTVSCVVAGGVVLTVGVLLLANSYFSSLKSNISGWMSQHRAAEPPAIESVTAVPEKSESALQPKAPPAGGQPAADHELQNPPDAESVLFTPGNIVNGVSGELLDFLTRLQQRFQELPLVRSILNELSTYLTEGEAQKQLAELLLKKSGGLFAFLAKFVALFATFLLNLLLTFFFFSLFLSKLAGFINNSEHANQQSTSYLIRTVFNGKWLPSMSEENLREGDRIVGEVVNKLRIWLRGYLTMIAIDFCVYTTFFTLLKVPYAPILGAIAGVGILLPYIGPVSSALLTVLITLAVGGPAVSALQIAGIIAVYLIHNGIIEQFFIYPWIIGESLGLTTLETIIVVLLGGILAGIPGMIFALPTAAVVKYLVPQIYRCWK